KFFFSSRRRHTRCLSDWSSDVCSSDLHGKQMLFDLLLERYQQTKEKHLLAMAETTLEKMARGGVYDQLAGGFHRYSVDERWLVQIGRASCRERVARSVRVGTS